MLPPIGIQIQTFISKNHITKYNAKFIHIYYTIYIRIYTLCVYVYIYTVCICIYIYIMYLFFCLFLAGVFFPPYHDGFSPTKCSTSDPPGLEPKKSRSLRHAEKAKTPGLGRFFSPWFFASASDLQGGQIEHIWVFPKIVVPNNHGFSY